MTDEAALKVAQAIEHLANAIERACGSQSLLGGIHIYHHNDGLNPLPSYPPRSTCQSEGGQ
jgi:hypothetical protein